MSNLRAEYPADRLRAAVMAALADHNPSAAVEILELMVRLHPTEGVALYDELLEASVIAKFLHGRAL